MVCFVIGSPGSLIVLIYFITKKKSVSTCLYVCISFVDLLISLMALAPAVSHFYQGSYMMFANKLHCHLWGYFWVTCARMSVMLIAVLSIARTVALALPFYRVKKVHVIVPVVVLSLILLVVSSSSFYLGKKRGMYYAQRTAKCQFNPADVVGESKTSFVFFLMLIPILLPFFTILISCCLSVYSLRSRRRFDHGYDQGTEKRDATVTIVLLTVGYIVFNAPLVLWGIIWMLEGEPILKILVGYFGDNITNYQVIFSFLQVNTVQLNSVFNVAVYFWRMQGLRRFIRNVS